MVNMVEGYGVLHFMASNSSVNSHSLKWYWNGVLQRTCMSGKNSKFQTVDQGCVGVRVKVLVYSVPTVKPD